jgi:hypothetical protein
MLPGGLFVLGAIARMRVARPRLSGLWTDGAWFFLTMMANGPSLRKLHERLGHPDTNGIQEFISSSRRCFEISIPSCSAFLYK